jgi:hypothetical protein
MIRRNCNLTTEYVETGNVLCKWVGLDQRMSLQQARVLYAAAVKLRPERSLHHPPAIPCA